MPDIDIIIGGRSFQVTCQPGEEHFLRAAAAMLDSEAQPLLASMGRLPEARLLLMSGLMLADKAAADKAAADKAIDEHNMTDMKLVLMDSADLASRSANMAADAGIELRLASKKLVDAHVQQRRLQFFLVFLCGCLMVVACGVFGAMAWRLQSRVEQLDSMMLAIGKRVVGMDASMESVGSVQQALQELMVKQEASAAIQTKIDARLEEVIKTSQATPDLLVKQLDGSVEVVREFGFDDYLSSLS